MPHSLCENLLPSGRMRARCVMLCSCQRRANTSAVCVVCLPRGSKRDVHPWRNVVPHDFCTLEFLTGNVWTPLFESGLPSILGSATKSSVFDKPNPRSQSWQTGAKNVKKRENAELSNRSGFIERASPQRLTSPKAHATKLRMPCPGLA